MKELSIEEKAKRYDEALGKARRYYDEYKTRDNILYVEDMEDMFPELKESEDERIRKWIIGVLSTYEHDRDLRNAAIDWLEKQGEQKIDPDTLIQQRVDALADIIAEQKPIDKVEPRFKVGDKIQYSKGCGTIMTIEKIENGEYIFSNNMGHTTIENGNKWYLVNRVEQKPAWSEGDEKILQDLIDHFEYKKEFTEAEDFNILLWLKSLKERHTWKPSDEQMKALEWQVNNTSEDSWQYEESKNLLEQLKKLKG